MLLLAMVLYKCKAIIVGSDTLVNHCLELNVAITYSMVTWWGSSTCQ
jgi:hypothetical protein